MTHDEEQWAVALKKARNAARKRRTVPLEREWKQAREEIRQRKKQLTDAVHARDMATVESILRRLIDLRARLAALEGERLARIYGETTKRMTENIRSKYIQDCVQLVYAISAHVVQ